ncbi:MAG: cyclic nucleotide-binding domain-containing protein [Deltaproteobacteria bacterium]|nr:cyclic nucleotide-binding domain-containing protein [Deltaproteobacteria bacterium]
MQETIFTPLEDYIKEKCSTELDLNKSGFQIASYRKNDVIFSEGSKGYAAYILKKGSVEISVKVKGKKVPLTTLREKSVFGEMALILAEHKRTATATALEDSEIAKIPKGVFDKYMTDSPRFISKCLIAIARRLQESTDKASKTPDTFMGVAQILDLFWEHDTRELSYGKTVTSLWKALSKGKAEITRVISLMESLNLLQVKDGEKEHKTIYLLGEGSFIEKAIHIHQILEGYQDAYEA